MRNARRHTAASDATLVYKHQSCVYGYGGYSHLAYIGGPGCELAGLRSHFCECAIRGHPPPHPTLLMFANITCTYIVTVNIATLPILEASGAQSHFRGSHFANAQYKAPYRRIRLYSCSQTSRLPLRSLRNTATLPILETLGVHSRFLELQFANRQCEAVRRRIRRRAHSQT